jgi:hypothetical protein
MFQLPAYLLGIALVFITTSNGQPDQTLCPGGALQPPPDPKWRTIPPRFEIMAELVQGNTVLEISQAFSTVRDAIAMNSKAGAIEFYWNFATSEQFEVLTAVINGQAVPMCLRQVITPQSQTSVIQPNSNILKPSILLGYDSRNQRDPLWSIRYDGVEDMRGIPTNRFKSCFYVNDIRATVAATYYVSDVDRFQAYLPANISIILKIDVIVSIGGRQEASTYNVFRYTPEPGRREERQALETPAGVFCPNRTSTLDLPSNIPERVSVSSEMLIPRINSSILSAHRFYDTEFQFTLFDVWSASRREAPRWEHSTEIHDFAVGLRYRFVHSTGRCNVSDIRPNSNDAVPSDDSSDLLQMGNPQHILLMDDMSFHYTGEKQCHDRVWCHVWIGQKPTANNTGIEQREWYWASRYNDEQLENAIPMKLIIKRYEAGSLIGSVEINLFNYRRHPRTVFEIDFTLANCYRALGPAEKYNLAVLSFKITNDKNYPVFENLNFLRLHIWETLIFTMFVRPIRISNIIVDKDGSDILVTFTLLDAPPRTGPVDNPLQEPSLDTLIERLTTIIDANGLAFRASIDSKQVVLRAAANSLNIGHRSSEQKWKSSGPKITGLWIGLIVVGLVVGLVGGFIVFRRLTSN